MIRYIIIIMVLIGLQMPLFAAENVMAPRINVATNVVNTRNQTWASTEWCEAAKCWLVVWREGYLNESSSDIWCARISADGKALDPAGIRLTSGKGFSDRPRVSSDGKQFLVVWENRPAKNDWDVVGRIVSAAGKPSGDAPFLISGGAHNQCRPDVAFAKGNYHVLWMAFDKEYSIHGNRISPDGKLLADAPVVIAHIDKKKKKNSNHKDNPWQTILPAIAANDSGDLLAAFYVRDAYRVVYMGRRAIDATTGLPLGDDLKRGARKGTPGGVGWGGRDRTPSLAFGKDCAISVASSENTRDVDDVWVGQMTKTGDVLGITKLGSPLSYFGRFKPIWARTAVTPVGDEFLVVAEVMYLRGVQRKQTIPPHRQSFARVLAWRVTADGKAKGAAFSLTSDTESESVLPDVAAGAAGKSLIVYSEIRGVDNVKIVAQIVESINLFSAGRYSD